MDWLRKLVSKQLVRVEEPHVNLDLAYILKAKIIAMSYPSSGVQSIYRNKIEDVYSLLGTQLS
jgi:phosphatidylinositol-3,4,5-trisphosphate 3-phosphatase and dual-specificity protein phosphatase PTEN